MLLDVFISCSHLNEAFAEQLQSALRDQKLNVQLCLDNAPRAPGAWACEARLMIVVASSPSLHSARVQDDIEAARGAGLPLIMAQIGPLKVRAEAPDGAVWVDEIKDQSAENLGAIVGATLAQLEIARAETRAKGNAATTGAQGVQASAPTDERHDVFISHSSKDKAQANLLWEALEKRGHKCWIAPESIGPGQDWPTAIEEGVENSAVLALLFNANSDGSAEVRTELAFAKE